MSMAITARTVTITPAVAKKYLDHNTKNRRIKRKNIEKYARDMQQGNWMETGEAIKFDSDGNLLDGQNRLHAVIRAETDITMLVIRGLNASAQDVMDSGVPRNNGDMFTLHGFPSGKDVASAANTYAAWLSGFYGSAMVQNTPKLTQSEARDLINKHPGLATSAAKMNNVYRRLRLPRGAMAVVHYATQKIDTTASDDFWDRIVEFRTEGAGDPVATLLKRVADDREARVRIWPATALFLMFRTWNAYRDGEELTRLLVGSQTRGWATIPEPH